MARNKLYLDKAKKHSACLSNEIFFKDGKQIKLSVIQARNKIQCLFSDEESKTRFRKKMYSWNADGVSMSNRLEPNTLQSHRVSFCETVALLSAWRRQEKRWLL